MILLKKMRELYAQSSPGISPGIINGNHTDVILS